MHSLLHTRSARASVFDARALVVGAVILLGCSSSSTDGSTGQGSSGSGSGGTTAQAGASQGGSSAGAASGGQASGAGGTAGAMQGGSGGSAGQASGGASTGGNGGAGTGGSSAGGSSGGGGDLDWKKANLTNFTSYPDPGSEECIEYNGCTWAGQFAAVDGKQPESWVMANNIAAVHSKDFETYKLKTLRLRMGDSEIDVKVYDMCADSDCSGCCTANASETGFLIDVEKYTMERFGHGDGIVDWACLDC